MHLYIDGNLVGEKLLYPLMKDGHDQDDLKKISLSGNDGNDEKLQGYVYNVQVLPVSSSIVDHFMKVHIAKGYFWTYKVHSFVDNGFFISV